MRERTLRELTLRLKNAAPTLQLEENADMARYTTLHLGGPADLMANPDDPAQIPLLIETARELDVPVTVIGNGSNLLVRSGGIRGLVIRTCRNSRTGGYDDVEPVDGGGGLRPWRIDLRQRHSGDDWRRCVHERGRVRRRNESSGDAG